MSAAPCVSTFKESDVTIYTDCGRIKNAMSWQEHTITVVLGLLHHSNVSISAFLNHILQEALVCAEALEYFDLLKC